MKKHDDPAIDSSPAIAQGSAFAPKDGCFIGANQDHWLRMRVDLAKFQEISGEVQYTGPLAGPPETEGSPSALASLPHGDDTSVGRPSPTRFASFRTTEGADPCTIDWFHASGTITPGRVLFEQREPHTGHRPDETMRVTLEIADFVSPGGTRKFKFDIVWTGPELRAVELRVLKEVGAKWPASAAGKVQDSPSTPELEPVEQCVRRVEDCFRKAGIDVRSTIDNLPATAAGPWQESDIFAVLSEIMGSDPSENSHSPGFNMELLALSRTDYGTLAGVMFDVTDCLPRQGAAVFLDTIRSIAPADRFQDEMISIAVHELGHAFNLVHSFDPDVRRSSAVSFMNYPARYRTKDPDGAGWGPQERAEAFWKVFDYDFDDLELRHLRHASWSQIVPGASPFGSAPYWDRDRTERRDDPDDPGLKLWLTPPPAGSVFAYGQHIFMQVSLLNAGKTPILIPRHALDIKAGDLQLLLSRVAARSAAWRSFTPMMRRCFDVGRVILDNPEQLQEQPLPKGMLLLGPGESIHSNLNLSYGSNGPSFAEPGSYDLRPCLSLAPGADDEGRDRVVTGRTVRITVLPPQTKREERDGELLFRPDIGASLALGGSTALQRAADDLAELQARRERETRGPDPVVPALARSAGISLRRQGRNREAADRLAAATSPAALAFFDPHTADHTWRLARKLHDRPTAATLPPTVVVDLWARPKAGGPTRFSRITGFLATDGSQQPPAQGPAPEKFQSWHVLASAMDLPQEVLSSDASDVVYAEITSASQDGLTERIGASQINVLEQDPHLGPEVLHLQLNRPVPTDPVPLARRYSVSSDRPGAGFFGPPTDALAKAASRTGDQLSARAATVDDALMDLPAPAAAPPPARVRIYRSVNLQDVAWWPGCIFSRNGCVPGQPEIDKPAPDPSPRNTKGSPQKSYSVPDDDPGSVPPASSK